MAEHLLPRSAAAPVRRLGEAKGLPWGKDGETVGVAWPQMGGKLELPSGKHTKIYGKSPF